MQLKFNSNEEYTLNRLEYEALWLAYGEKIQQAFKTITGLSFREEIIEAIVGDYKSNFAGHSLSEPMLFRFSVRHKLGTILHELAHRFLLEYQFQYTGIVENDHELIDLFLYDIIQEAFGEGAAKERLNYELTFPETEIPQAWDKIMKYSKLKRQELWKSVVRNINFEENI